MNEADAIEIVQRIFASIIFITAPMVVAAMMVGVIIAVFQAITQIQEASLTFIPKMIAMLLAFSLSTSIIGSTITSLAQFVFSHIETGY